MTMTPRYSLAPQIVWLLLVIATGITFAAGEFGTPGRGLIIGVLALAFFKGRLVILDFMELRHGPSLWRRAVLGWLFLGICGIVFAYLKGMP